MPNDNIMGIKTKACVNGVYPDTIPTIQQDIDNIEDDIDDINTELDNVVHKTGDEEINGEKTFTEDLTVHGDEVNTSGTVVLSPSSQGGIVQLKDNMNRPISIVHSHDSDGNCYLREYPDNYYPVDENENPVAPSNPVIMTSGLVAVDPRIVHTTGNEIVAGTKQGNWVGYKLTDPNPSTAGKWLRYAIFDIGYASTILEIYGTRANNGLGYAMALIGGGGGAFQRSASAINCYPSSYANPVVAVLNTTTGKIEIWIYVFDVNQVKETYFYVRFGMHYNRFVFPQTEHDTISNEDGDTYGSQVVILGQVTP